MNTGISDPITRALRLALLGAGLSMSLAACNGAGGQGFSFAPRNGAAEKGAQDGPVVPTLRKAELARGSVTLQAPKGYCIDATSVSSGLQGSSALLARCSSLEGKGAGAEAAVMTVNISPRRGEGSPAPTTSDLAAASSAKVKNQTQRGQLALVQFGSGGDALFKPADPVHWRGATTLDTRLVLLGLYAPSGSEMTGPKGADLLASLAKGLSATRGSLLGLSLGKTEAEGEVTAENQPKIADTLGETDTVETEKKGLGKLIGRLLNRS